MWRHFLAVAIMAAFASVAVRLFITNANVLAGKVGLRG